jgi:hypothetical protein
LKVAPATTILEFITMRSLCLALLTTLAAATTLAQADPLRVAGDEKAFAKLRGISFFFIDVTTSENRPEDADLRTEIRDAMELEMRRANIVPRNVEGLPPENATPLLTIDIRLDRGLGRYNADVVLSVRDNATITRNKEAVLAQSYAQSKRAMGTSEATLSREIKARGRELVQELLAGIKNLK